MKKYKRSLTYVIVFLSFIVLILFTTITQINELANLIGTIIGVFIAYMFFDFIFAKLLKVGESKAVLFSFALVLLFFIIFAISSSSYDAIYQLKIQIAVSILLLLIFLQLAHKDEEEKKRLLSLPDNSNINLSQLSIITNKSERYLKFLISKGNLSTIESQNEDILFNKGIALNELNVTV